MFTSRMWRLQPIDDKNKEQQKIEKELNPTNLEDLLEYIQLFIHLFNKNRFKCCQNEENGTIK